VGWETVEKEGRKGGREGGREGKEGGELDVHSFSYGFADGPSRRGKRNGGMGEYPRGFVRVER